MCKQAAGAIKGAACDVAQLRAEGLQEERCCVQGAAVQRKEHARSLGAAPPPPASVGHRVGIGACSNRDEASRINGTEQWGTGRGGTVHLLHPKHARLWSTRRRTRQAGDGREERERHGPAIEQAQLALQLLLVAECVELLLIRELGLIRARRLSLSELFVLRGLIVAVMWFWMDGASWEASRTGAAVCSMSRMRRSPP